MRWVGFFFSWIPLGSYRRARAEKVIRNLTTNLHRPSPRGTRARASGKVVDKGESEDACLENLPEAEDVDLWE